MQEDENEEIRPQLYERFREALVKPVGERFFDEDELVEIFDYAGDVNDDYVRAEVLFCGERLYPDSDLLRVRRSILYSECMPGTNAFSDFVRDNAPAGESMIWKIERVLDEFPSAEAAPGALDSLLNYKESLDDEEIIRLVKLARDLSCTEWLLANIDGLRARAGYLPVLLYELGCVFTDAAEYEYAEPFFEELTRLEPFVATYWALLFSVQTGLGRYDDARESFEFASNLELTDPETAVLLAPTGAEELADLRPQAIAILEKALRQTPDYYRAVEALARLYALTGDKDKASEILLDYSALMPRVREASVLAIELGLDSVGPIFQVFMDATHGEGYSYDDMLRCLHTLMDAGHYWDVRRLCVAYSKYAPTLTEIQMIFIEASFMVQDYQSCLDMYRDPSAVLALFVSPAKGARVAYIYYTSLIALGHADDARIFAELAAEVARKLIPTVGVFDRLLLQGLISELEK